MFSHEGIRGRIGRISYSMSRPPWKRSSPFSGWWRDHGTSLQDKHRLTNASQYHWLIVHFKPTQWECWDHRLSFSPSDPSSKLWASGSSVKSPPEYERAFLPEWTEKSSPSDPLIDLSFRSDLWTHNKRNTERTWNLFLRKCILK